MKIGVFGNCQSVGMAASISALVPDAEVHRFGVREAQDSDEGEIQSQMNAFATCDYVFLQPSMKHNIDALQLNAFSTRCREIVPYPLIASRVSHPDCHYLSGADGKHFVGPMGQYQSAIAAGSYLSGLSAQRAVTLYNKFTYEKMGFSHYNNEKEVVGREALSLGYDFNEFFSGSHGPFMHTINHPRINIIFETARQALNKIGLSVSDGAVVPPDNLSRNTVWPIYPGLPGANRKESDLVFKLDAKNLRLSLPEFVEASYEAFRAADGAFRSDLSDRVKAFIATHVV